MRETNMQRTVIKQEIMLQTALVKRNFVTEEPHLLISHTALKKSIFEYQSYLFKGGGELKITTTKNFHKKISVMI